MITSQVQTVSPSKCIVCKSSQIKILYDGILKCQECTHVFANSQLSDEELFELYRENYFFGEEYIDYIADKACIQKNLQMRFNVLKRFLNFSRHQNLFEIGSAYGFFLDLMRGQFSTVSGIDITQNGVRYAREELKLDVAQADLISYDLGQRKFDVVCLWDTIEHLSNPHLYLEKISRHMEEGALIALTTGDIESWNARRRKENWRLIHPPTHLHYFSRKSMEKMLNNYGFEVIYNRYCGFYRSIDNTAYNILVLRGQRPKIYEWLKKTRLTRLNFYLNMYDIMFVIARKRNKLSES